MKTAMVCMCMISILAVACKSDEKIDWRDKYQGIYTGSGKLTSYALERQDQWQYDTEIEVVKDLETKDQLIIKRRRVDKINSGVYPPNFFSYSFDYSGIIYPQGNLSVPAQNLDLKVENETFQLAPGDVNNSIWGSSGEFEGDSAMLIIAFANKDIIDTLKVKRQ